MRFSYKALPGGDGEYLRPVVPVRIESSSVQVAALADTGSLGNRFGRWVAESVGVALEGADEEHIALGGVVTAAQTVPVDLVIGDSVWRAPVSFCDPWPFPFQLLGQEGFFRFFTVTFRASTYELEISEDRGGEFEVSG